MGQGPGQLDQRTGERHPAKTHNRSGASIPASSSAPAHSATAWAGTGCSEPAVATRSGHESGRCHERQRNHDGVRTVDRAVCLDGAGLGVLEFSPDQTIRVLAGLDLQRLDRAGHLFARRAGS